MDKPLIFGRQGSHALRTHVVFQVRFFDLYSHGINAQALNIFHVGLPGPSCKQIYEPYNLFRYEALPQIIQCQRGVLNHIMQNSGGLNHLSFMCHGLHYSHWVREIGLTYCSEGAL